MAEQVEALALIEAVAEFIKSIESELSGRSAFHAKVAANALGIAARELELQPAATEQAALSGFLGNAAGLDALRAEVCGRLRSGQLTPETPGLLEALQAVVVAKLSVDNPRYATLGRLR